MRRARAVVMAATPWSQSVWETEARRLCLIDGIAAPQPQMPVRTEAGVFYADLGWRAAMLAYEIDGEIKYLQDADAALSAQYRRETAIEAAGVHVERATPADVADGEGFLTGLRGVLPQSLCEENPVTALRPRFVRGGRGGSWGAAGAWNTAPGRRGRNRRGAGRAASRSAATAPDSRHDAQRAADTKRWTFARCQALDCRA